MGNSEKTLLDTRDRALGALYGAAIGDALGMPTQDLTPDVIREDYGPIDKFLPAGPRQVIAAGQDAGTITDDTEQMVIVARLLCESDGFDALRFAEELDLWEQDMRRRGSLDLLGPSTKAAIEALRGGASPEESGSAGVTNGAAMRAAPIGVAQRPLPDGELLKAVNHVSRVTHNTRPGIAAAAAVAAAVSAGVDGWSLESSLAHAMRISALAEESAPAVPGPSFTARWRAGLEFLSESDRLLDDAYEVIGTTVTATESVVTAMIFCQLIPDPWLAVTSAASVGGDTDTIATIVGAVLGSVYGMEIFPQEVIEQLVRVNDLDLEGLVDCLLRRRGEPGF